VGNPTACIPFSSMLDQKTETRLVKARRLHRALQMAIIIFAEDVNPDFKVTCSCQARRLACAPW
jgi:hypothetical protein